MAEPTMSVHQQYAAAALSALARSIAGGPSGSGYQTKLRKIVSMAWDYADYMVEEEALRNDHSAALNLLRNLQTKQPKGESSE